MNKKDKYSLYQTKIIIINGFSIFLRLRVCDEFMTSIIGMWVGFFKTVL